MSHFCMVTKMESQSENHNKCRQTVIKCACLCFQNGEEFDIQVLSSSAIYRPSKTVVDNLQQRNFLGQAKVSCN